MTTARENGVLRLSVRDDGRGLNGSVRERVGLGNTRTRLRELYGDRHRFALADAPGGGAVATIEIPFRRSEPAVAEREVVEVG